MKRIRKIGRPGYDTDVLLKKALENIEKKKYVFHADVQFSLGIAMSTYYEHFPKDSELYNKIDIALHKNKIDIKAAIRNKWFRSKSDQGGLYLYKLLGTKEERDRLSYNKNDNSGEMTIKKEETIDLSKLSDKALEELENAFKGNK